MTHIGAVTGDPNAVDYWYQRYLKLERAAMEVIFIDRLNGGKNEKEAGKKELLPDDSVKVADLLRGMGLPIGDYP
jgi:hypothetical protein